MESRWKCPVDVVEMLPVDDVYVTRIANVEHLPGLARVMFGAPVSASRYSGGSLIMPCARFVIPHRAMAPIGQILINQSCAGVLRRRD